MSSRGPWGRLTVIAFLVISLLATAFQAKLGLYRREQSQVNLISEAFKPSECRLDRTIPVPPLATAVEAITDEAPGDWRPEPDSVEYVPVRLHPLLGSPSHWFRPPPVRS